jgi:SAM-dependent methyltransferase
MNFLDKLDGVHFEESLDSDLLGPWKTYLSEAKWGWYLLSSEIDELKIDSKVLEIGAGPQMLSAQVASKGVKLTSLEPSSQGFEVMDRLGKIVQRISLHEEISYEFHNTSGEDFFIKNEFDFAFSINVMEHVNDIELVLTNVLNSLKPGGRYHFICPNYAFPYEPHFNSITFVNKRATDTLIKSRLIRKSKLIDPVGLWESLNWIDYGSIRSWAKNQSDFELVFSRRALNLYVTRAIEDKVFQFRHPILSKLTQLFRPVVFLVMYLTPVRYLPILDVMIVKKSHRT